MGSRVLKSVADETSAELHTLEVFSSLRVERAQLLGDDYELDENTERVSLAGLGKLVYDPALPSWSGEPKHVFLTMSDHLGSAAFVLDRDSGEVVEKITHQAYGEVESDYRPARWKSQREVHRFTGKEDDFEVGLTYFGARYYHARLGRWMSPDPLTIHLGASDPNPYAYVSGRASTHFDPNGLCSADDASDCIGGAYWADTHQPWLSVGDDYWQPQFGDGGLIGHTYREWVADGRPSTTFGPEPVGPEIGPSSPPVTSIGTGGQAAGSAGGWANTYSETPISNPRSDYLASQHPALKASIQGARNQELVVEYAPWVLALLPAMRGVAADEALLAAAGRRGPAATRDLAQKVAAAERGPMRFMRTVTVLETKEGPTLVAGGASDLSPGQVEVARSLGLTPAPPMPGIHAEPNAIFGAGELGLTPVRGATTSRICAGPGGCTETIQQLGGRITSPFTYEF